MVVQWGIFLSGKRGHMQVWYGDLIKFWILTLHSTWKFQVKYFCQLKMELQINQKLIFFAILKPIFKSLYQNWKCSCMIFFFFFFSVHRIVFRQCIKTHKFAITWVNTAPYSLVSAQTELIMHPCSVGAEWQLCTRGLSR